MTDIETVLARVRSKTNGRTRYEGQEPYDDEVMLAEIERLQSIVEELVVPVEIIRAKARKAAIEEAEKATWIGLQPYVDNLTQGKHPELVTFRLLTDIRATIRALAEDAHA